MRQKALRRPLCDGFRYSCFGLVHGVIATIKASVATIIMDWKGFVTARGPPALPFIIFFNIH